MITLIFTGLGCCPVCSWHQGQGRIWASACVDKDTCGRKNKHRNVIRVLQWRQKDTSGFSSLPFSSHWGNPAVSQKLSRLIRSDLRLWICFILTRCLEKTSNANLEGVNNENGHGWNDKQESKWREGWTGEESGLMKLAVSENVFFFLN